MSAEKVATATRPTVSDPVPDVLGTDFDARTITVADAADGPQRATLVRRACPTPTTHAVLYVHGYNDYFFQTELAEHFCGRGHTFYAIDLHRYGRSLLPGQVFNDMADVSEYNAELDAALEVIRTDGHDRATVVAHSTGGLIVPLWLTGSPRAAMVDALVLNSPFLDINATLLAKTVVGRGVDVTARFRPGAVLPLPDAGLYGRSIHTSGVGEWAFDPAWKPLLGMPIRVGWLAAIRRAQRRLRHNLGLTLPILVLCSTRTVRVKQWSDEMMKGDAVLDADAIADRSTRLGLDVTCVRIPDGMHDLVLSPRPVRDHVYRVIDDWLGSRRPA